MGVSFNTRYHIDDDRGWNVCIKQVISPCTQHAVFAGFDRIGWYHLMPDLDFRFPQSLKRVGDWLIGCDTDRPIGWNDEPLPPRLQLLGAAPRIELKAISSRTTGAPSGHIHGAYLAYHRTAPSKTMGPASRTMGSCLKPWGPLRTTEPPRLEPWGPV